MQGQVHILIAYNRHLDKLVFLDTVQGHIEVPQPGTCSCAVRGHT